MDKKDQNERELDEAMEEILHLRQETEEQRTGSRGPSLLELLEAAQSDGLVPGATTFGWEEPSVELEEVIETVKTLTPELIKYLSSHDRNLARVRWQVFEHLIA